MIDNLTVIVPPPQAPCNECVENASHHQTTQKAPGELYLTGYPFTIWMHYWSAGNAHDSHTTNSGRQWDDKRYCLEL